MKIIIDNREPDELKECIRELCNKNNNIEIQTDNLDLGDFLIYKNNLQIPDVIIERKSLNDLIASIKDGRYNEQSYRLDQSNVPNHNIYYIIEGSIESNKNSIVKQTLYSSIFTLSYFKGFSIINSLSIKQTATYIYRFIDKLQRENNKNPYFKHYNIESIDNSSNDNIITSDNTNKYSSTLKTSKKSNITQENILEIMLMQIPNVSLNVAQQISYKFKNMKNLITNLENNKSCLNDLYVTFNSKRKISTTTVNNIIKYLLQETVDINIDV